MGRIAHVRKGLTLAGGVIGFLVAGMLVGA